MFSGISDSCAKLTAPAMNAVREYTGELFSAAVEFEDSSSQPSGADRPVKVCSAAYVAPGTPAQPQSTNAPLRRVVTLAFEVHLGDDPVISAKRHFDRARENTKGSTTGLGDESFDGSGGTTETTAVTAFRKSNGYVDVSVSGSNASGQKGKANPNAELSDLTPGARAIAKALADNIGAVFTLR